MLEYLEARKAGKASFTTFCAAAILVGSMMSRAIKNPARLKNLHARNQLGPERMRTLAASRITSSSCWSTVGSPVLILRSCSSRTEAEHEIKVTLWHEIGHYLGMSEDDLHRLGYG